MHTAYDVPSKTARVSLDNGRTYRPVSDLSEEEVGHFMTHFALDPGARESAHSLGPDTDREFLRLYASEHEAIHREWPVLG